MHGRRGYWRRYRGAKDTIEFREILVQVRLPFRGDLSLVRGFAVARENFLDHVHAAGDLAEGREAHGIEPRIFTEADKKLSGAGIRSRSGESQKAGVIALGDGIVLDVGLLPRGVYGGVGVETKLHHEARDDAEESGVGKEAVLHQIIETIGAQRGPGAGDGDDKVTSSSFERHFVLIGCGGLNRGGMQ